MQRVRLFDTVSVPKYRNNRQLVISLTDKLRQQNNATNEYYVNVGSGNINNNNNKNNTYGIRAYDENVPSQLLESLIVAMRDCLKNKRSKADCIEFSMQKDVVLKLLETEILENRYSPRPSKCFVVDYPTWREVWAADFADRIIHHWIALRVEPLMEDEFIDDSYNCRKGKGTAYAIRRLCEMIEFKSANYTKPCWIVKYDFKGYFMSINKHKLWRMLEKLIVNRYVGDDKDILLMLTKKTVFNEPKYNYIRKSSILKWKHILPEKSLFTIPEGYGVPIGNLTSQLFANYYPHKQDIYLKNKYDCYFRYVDDGGTVIDEHRLIRLFMNDVKMCAMEIGVRVHPNKFYCQPVEHGVSWVGVFIKKHRIYISNRTHSKAIQKVYGRNHWDVKDERSIRKVLSSVNSYLGAMRQCAAYNIRKKICKMISPKWYEHFAVVGNYKKLKISEYYE